MEAKKAVEKIKKEFDENNNSHVFLVETNDTESCISDVKEIIKSIIAADDEVTSYQIDNETYLELIVVSPEEKSIKIDQIKELQDRIKTKPVLSDFIFYIIVPTETLNEEAANKLLKTIEEPNKNVIGFMITKNSDLLLPTIKSRCEMISMSYDSPTNIDAIDGSIKEIAKSLIRAIENQNHIEYYKIKAQDKNIKENAKVIENLIKDYYNTACHIKRKGEFDEDLIAFMRSKNDFRVLVKKAKYMNSVLNKLAENMNSDLMLEKIFIDLKGVK